MGIRIKAKKRNIIQWKEHGVRLSVGSCDDVLNTDGLSDEEIAKKIKDFLRKTRTARQWWLPIVPTHEVLLRVMSVPSSDEKEARKMIQWQVQGRWGDEKDLVTDYVLALCSDAGTKALVAVIEQTRLIRYWNIMRTAGVLFNDWSVSCLLAKNSVEGYLKSEGFSEEGDYGFLYFDGERCDLCFVVNRWPVLVRSFMIGDQKLMIEKSTFLLQQIDVSLRAYQQEQKTEIPRIVLLGEGKEIDVFKRSLDEKVSTLSCPVDFLIGEAQRKEPLTFHWIPSVIKEESIKKFYVCQWATFVILSVLFVSLALSFVGVWYYKEVAFLNQVRRKEEALRQQVEGLQRMKQQLGMVVGKSGQRMMVTDLWGKLDALRPASLYLTRLEWHAKGGMVLQGVAASEADINEWQKRIAAAHLFDDVVLQSAQRQREGSDEHVYFKIRCTTVGEDDH